MPDAGRPILRYPLSWRSWRFRLVAAILLLALLARLVWGWRVGRLLQEQYALARGRGEPATLAEAKFEHIPDSENAWKIQMSAAAAQSETALSPSNISDDWVEYPPYPASWMKRAAASEAANAQAFVLARRARALSKVQTRDRFETPLIKHIVGPDIYNARKLTNTLGDGAIYSHLRGDDAEAIERILDLAHLAQSMRRDPFFVSQLVAVGMESVAAYDAQVIAPGLQAKGGATTQPATRDSIRKLINVLLDDRIAWEGFASSFAGERLLLQDNLTISAGGTWLIRPLADMNFVRENRNLEIEIAAGNLRNYPAAKTALKGVKEEDLKANPLQWVLGGEPKSKNIRYSRWFPSYSIYVPNVYQYQFRVLAERRATAVSLAAQLYCIDHARWPLRIEELTPDYLDSVPIDPFQDDGRTLGYEIRKGALPGGGDRPLVYFDSVPDAVSIVKKEPMYGWQSWQPLDLPRAYRERERQYRDLARFVPIPATQPAKGTTSKGFGRFRRPATTQASGTGK